MRSMSAGVAGGSARAARPRKGSAAAVRRNWRRCMVSLVASPRALEIVAADNLAARLGEQRGVDRVLNGRLDDPHRTVGEEDIRPADMGRICLIVVGAVYHAGAEALALAGGKRVGAVQ